MSRSHKGRNYLYGPKRWYKAFRVRRERARQREALGAIKALPAVDSGDWEDRCGNDDCDICGTQYAPDAGPKHELAHFDHWAYD